MLIQSWDRGNNGIFDTDKALQQKFAAILWESYHWYVAKFVDDQEIQLSKCLCLWG